MKVENELEADQYADAMSKFCPGVKAFFIAGVPCMLKIHVLLPEGYANGSQGRMLEPVYNREIRVVGAKKNKCGQKKSDENRPHFFC